MDYAHGDRRLKIFCDGIIQIKSLLYTRYDTEAGGVRLRDLAHGQHNREETSPGGKLLTLLCPI